MVPKELKACVIVNRLEAVSGFPKMVTYGLAATCNKVMPEAKTKNQRFTAVGFKASARNAAAAKLGLKAGRLM